MSDDKFTPGPWVRGSCDSWIIWAPRYQSTDWKQEDGPEGVPVAVIEARAWANDRCDPEVREAWLAESDATSNLIAAAPDLYEALDLILTHDMGHESEHWDDDGNWRGPNILLTAAKALAKARGATP